MRSCAAMRNPPTPEPWALSAGDVDAVQLRRRARQRPGVGCVGWGFRPQLAGAWRQAGSEPGAVRRRRAHSAQRAYGPWIIHLIAVCACQLGATGLLFKITLGRRGGCRAGAGQCLGAQGGRRAFSTAWRTAWWTSRLSRNRTSILLGARSRPPAAGPSDEQRIHRLLLAVQQILAGRCGGVVMTLSRTKRPLT